MVTPLQLARAFCVYANGGRLPDLRIVKGTLDAEGQVVTSRPRRAYQDLPQILNPQTADQIRAYSRRRASSWNGHQRQDSRADMERLECVRKNGDIPHF